MIYQVPTFPGREIFVDGKIYRYFGGTSYLGLQTNTDFQNLFIEHIKTYGTNYGASRKSNVQLRVFEESESTLAALVESEACITLSSGYLAGKLLSQHFDNDSFKCFFAPNTHSALYQTNTVPTTDFEDLVQSIKGFSETDSTKTIVVFLDSIDTIATAYPNFESLRKLPLTKLILCVDDSHGIGIMGENGGGAYQAIKRLGPRELIVCCSLGKGFGIQAGAILGNHNRISKLMDTDLFGGASPAAPAALASFIDGRSIYAKLRGKLRHNIELFLNETKTTENFNFIKNHPVFTFKNAALSEHLESNDILTTNFRYPNEAGALISRIVISAAHTQQDIKFLSQSLNSYNK